MMRVIRELSDEDKEQLKHAMIIVKNLGLHGEVCGSWLWVSGDTKINRECLNNSGFKWAPKKKLWFFRPTSQKSFSRGNWEMDKVRTWHGSQSI